ncbi:ORF6N domain-containing protein [Escherichia coli]|uniref:ORF6N domain-containing protein n=1 Tax=Escherichia coli TaxID=562 RepID=A0AAN5UJG1_ECOLX|nr:ORF6N domain-containing protein [Escherichia coli]EFH8064583.1 ORF6N domain-containing protein [Escherichia coli]EFL9938319.1 ORF6N domain-containing protein [Escherichia coli]ELS7814273.1 ORF6N domain-containing protein [Escherichia coli]ELT9957199.1 ORF6N domain-containing protein [Escherichia coli]
MFTERYETRPRLFFISFAQSHSRFMVGCVGEPKGSPVSVPGYANPAQFATSSIGVVGGDNFQMYGVIVMTTQISVETLSPITHNQIPVITTELLAQLYGTEILNIQVNFTRNKERFVEGKHFFKASGEELKNLRLTLSKSQNPISPKTRSLILWTERGAARHAKMLETDQAWEVFEKLEDSYFNQYEKERATGKMNIDIHLAIRDDKTAFIRSYAPGQLVTVEEALMLLKSRGWLVMPRDELAGKLMEL